MEEESSKIGFSDLKKYLLTKNASWSHFFKSWVTNPSYVILIFSNLAIFFLPGMDLKKQAVTIVWIYMMQSILIGIVHVFKLWFYKFSKPTRPTDWKNPKALAVFFLFHYGFFHFVYAFFINPYDANWDLVMQGAAVFGFALIINTFRHFKQENSGKYNANDFMFLPYVRVLPIHMAIILGIFFSVFSGNLAPVVYVLMILKTGMELFLEYLQQLGISFADIQDIKKIETNEPS